MLDRDRRSDDQRRRDALKWLAVARQVSDADPILGTVYLQAVAECDPGILQRACEQLGKEPRDEFRPAMPDVGTILARVRSIALADIEERAQARQLLPPDPNERLIRCLKCEDDPAGWLVIMRCPLIDCGDKKEHAPHHFTARCPCWLEKHREALLYAKQEHDKDRKKPIPVDYWALMAIDDGRYPWAKPRELWPCC